MHKNDFQAWLSKLNGRNSLFMDKERDKQENTQIIEFKQEIGIQ
ncbi:MAG: hypothetical protein BAJATHORv1_30342 [Candidatus Thorarchaeota archaeon]|nr:MAG: hypothetical protein BAJATHORv1_30342 [Candidatus Thorarchaeota archaeon]